jgi:hypothetical protein
LDDDFWDLTTCQSVFCRKCFYLMEAQDNNGDLWKTSGKPSLSRRTKSKFQF